MLAKLPYPWVDKPPHATLNEGCAQVLHIAATRAPSNDRNCLEVVMMLAACCSTAVLTGDTFVAGRAQLWGRPATAAGGHREEGPGAGTAEGGSPHSDGAAAGLPGMLR